MCDNINLIVQSGLATGIGSTTYTKLKVINDYMIANAFDIDESGINTITNRVTAKDHGLLTGDRILYYGANLPSGITQKEYFIVKVDGNEKYKEVKSSE